MEGSPLIILLAISPFLFWGYYGLYASGLHTISKNKKMKYAWLAWLPIGQLYMLGAIVGEIHLFGLRIPGMELILFWGPIALLFLIPVPALLYTLAGILVIVIILCLNTLYKRYAPKHAVLYTVLSCIGLAPVFVFIIRNNTPAEVSWRRGA